ncbi:F-box/kelch-repeat protein At3g06240-like [Argentina anserina]|uniref:F-box/kelch-repeat protein At3g06240-like n=1 Tax=Argentina anserina TaxID=57926 RepID=UPI0021763E27|nr:F-box/kelch-repeat protein At3g06240-like [Potentilla anserina]
MEVRMRNCKANSHSLPALPVEVKEDILSRLPVKSLCRFRCVSKSWHSLIYGPKFVKLHRDKTFQNEHVFRQRQRVIYTGHNQTILPKHGNTWPFSLYSFDLNSNIETLNEHDIVPTKLDWVFSELKHFEISWASHCNGLLLCKLHGQLLNGKYMESLLYMLNPATRKSKELPPPPDLTTRPLRPLLYGFGFDHSIDDYIAVHGKVYRHNGHLVTLFSVYTLKTGHWRVIEKQFPYSYSRCCSSHGGILLNGSFHWLMFNNPPFQGGPTMLVSLHLAEEEIREIPLPESFPSYLNLGVFREERLFITVNTPGLCNHIWVMMEYGNVESWTKVNVRVSIPNYLSRFCNWDQSWDLGVREEMLSLYNRNENCHLMQAIRGTGKVESVGVYLESLASLNDGEADLLLQEPSNGRRRQLCRWGANRKRRLTIPVNNIKPQS